MKEANKQNLAGFLIMPIQRIPRYHLLLAVCSLVFSLPKFIFFNIAIVFQDLVKHTWKDHPDYNNLRQAAEQMEQTSTLLNQKKKLAEGLKRLAEVAGLLRNEIPFYLAEPHRRLIREEKFDNLILFLFNDMVLVAHVNYVPKIRSKRKTLLSKTQTLPQENKRLSKSSDMVEELKLIHYCPLESVELVSPAPGKFVIRADGVQAPIFSCSDKPDKIVDKWIKKFTETRLALTAKNQARSCLHFLSFCSNM